MRYSRQARHPADDFRSDTADDVESTARRSKHKGRRSTPANKHHATEPNSPTQQRYSRPAKRCDDRQRREAMRRSELAQSSQSTGSMAVPRNAESTKRQRSLAAGRHVPRNKDRDARRLDSPDLRTLLSRAEHRSTEERQRRRHQQNSTSATQYIPSAARRRRDGRETHASTSKSVDSMSRHRGRPPSVQTTYSTSVAKQSNSTQPNHSVNHQPPAMFYECRPAVRYRSPRSLKPFPPPISDRCPPPSSDSSPAAVVETPLDDESFQYELVGRQDDSEYGGDLSGDRHDCPPPRRCADRLHRSARTDQRRQGNTATVGDGGGRRRRKKPAATAVVDGANWRVIPEVSAGVAVPSIVERPSWKRY